MQSQTNQHGFRGTSPRYDSVLLSITERCHVGCGHCGFNGAKREREGTLEEIRQWTTQLCDYGIGRLIMTGGEPFERMEAMEVAVQTAFDKIPIISTFTSSFWANSFESARTALQRLIGLKQLYLSSDTYHQKRVPYEYVKNAIEAALSLGLPYITICITYGNEDELVEVKRHYKDWEGRIEFHVDRVIPTPYLPKSVRQLQAAGARLISMNYGKTCYLQTPLINPNGELFACHSGKAGAHRSLKELPYYLGSLREMSFKEIVSKASRRWDYQYLRTEGPQGVAKLAEGNADVLVEVGRADFTTACDMCFSILKTKSGLQALHERTRNSDVRDNINVRLALGLGEEPLVD